MTERGGGSAVTAEINTFFNFCEMYDKLNKLEHFSKCLYKIINKFVFPI